MGLQERQVRIAEVLAAQLTLLMHRVIAELPIKAQPVARRSFQKHLALMTSDDDDGDGDAG